MTDDQHRGEGPLDLSNDDHGCPKNEQKICCDEKGNGTDPLMSRQSTSDAKSLARVIDALSASKTPGKQGKKEVTPKLSNAVTNEYFRRVDPRKVDRKALFGYRRIPKPQVRPKGNGVASGNQTRAVVAAKKPKQGKQQQTKGGKRKKEGMDVLMSMLGKLHV